MALLNSIALAGVGNLGSHVLDALLANGSFAVTVLTRASSDKTFPAGVNVQRVDYDDEAQLEAAVKGVDAVVSTLMARDAQAVLIRAAKKAGVKLFVPGEFGNAPVKNGLEKHPALLGKVKTQELLKELELPAILVYPGSFLDSVFQPFLGWDFAARKVRLVGAGETPIAFTTRRDVARFLVHHLAGLSALPAPDKPEKLILEGDRKTFREVVALYERTHPGVTLEIEDVPRAEVEEKAKDVAGDFRGSLTAHLLIEREVGSTAKLEELANGEWPEWKPLSVEEFLETLP
ncbi:hypothetical protein JCM10207_007154 [Rhodosporidiobolus poonsookiae]